MTEPKTENYSSDATPGFFSKLRVKTGGLNGVKILAIAAALHGILFAALTIGSIIMTDPITEANSAFFNVFTVIELTISLLIIISAFPLGSGRSIGWALFTPIPVLMVLMTATSFFSGLPEFVMSSDPLLLPLLMFFSPLTVVQAFRPSVLATLSIRPAAVKALFIPSCILIILLRLVSS